MSLPVLDNANGDARHVEALDEMLNVASNLWCKRVCGRAGRLVCCIFYLDSHIRQEKKAARPKKLFTA